jgi:hypothetical protein
MNLLAHRPPKRCREIGFYPGTRFLTPSRSFMLNAIASLSHSAPPAMAFATPSVEAISVNATSASPASAADHRSAASVEPASQMPALPNLTIDIPSEIWGEIACFSPRADILNLRTTSTSVRSEVDANISELTLTGIDRLRAFAQSPSFQQVKTLSVRYADHVSLRELISRLQRSPRPDLTLALIDGFSGLPEALESLKAVPLAELRLKNVYPLSFPEEAVAAYTFPINISGYHTALELAQAAHVPTLTTLTTRTLHFTHAVAEQFSSHPALQTLSVRTGHEIDSLSVGCLASIPHLHKLSLYETCSRSGPIDISATHALASNAALKSLSIYAHTAPFSAESFLALSHSATIKRLSIPVGPGMQCLGNMRTLEEITLRGDIRVSRDIDKPLATIIAGLHNLIRLQMHAVQFEKGAFRALLDTCVATDLRLQAVTVDESMIIALLVNTRLRSLNLMGVALHPEQVTALAQHRTLDRLQINNVAYVRQS